MTIGYPTPPSTGLSEAEVTAQILGDGTPGFDYRVGFVNALPAGATLAAAGLPAVAERGSGSDGTDADGIFKTLTSSGSLDSTGGLYVGPFTQRRHSPVVMCVVKQPTVLTDVRFCVGFVSAEDMGNNGPAHQAILRYYTSLTDASLTLACKDGTTRSTTATGVAASAGGKTKFKLWFDANGFNVQINDGTTYTHATNLPGASTALGFQIQSASVIAAARNVGFSRLGAYSL